MLYDQGVLEMVYALIILDFSICSVNKWHTHMGIVKLKYQLEMCNIQSEAVELILAGVMRRIATLQWMVKC